MSTTRSLKRVVITGVGAISPLGNDMDAMFAHLHSERNAVSLIPEWLDYEGMNTCLGCIAQPFDLPAHFNRKTTRSMGRVALMGTLASEKALADAGLLNDPWIKSGQMGVSYGSCDGSLDALNEFAAMAFRKNTSSINANTYIKFMSHTAAVNIGLFFGLTGRIITTSSACTSSSQGIGYAYEAIQTGKQTAMIAGGSEELAITQAVVFDTLFASSLKKNTPELTPRPFDRNRDGLVLGEGAASLILEEYEHAKARGAHIYAEIVGFGTNSDGAHVTHPTASTMAIAMSHALQDANLSPDAISYVNAHGTATEQGDIAETQATRTTFKRAVPISSLKSYMGHTLGACGGLEAMLTVEMMNRGWFAPTINLTEIDERVGDLDYLQNGWYHDGAEYVMSNNFAFGGVNTSLVFKRMP